MVLTGGYMMEIQQGGGITHANHEIFIEEVRKVNELHLRGSGSTRPPKLEHFHHLISARVCDHGPRVTLHGEGDVLSSSRDAYYRNQGSKSPSRTVGYWCFSQSSHGIIIIVSQIDVLYRPRMPASC
jgi:hypothetical protein